MMKTYQWLTVGGILLTALLAWRFGEEIYVVGWRSLHSDNVVVGSRKFRVPAGPYVWNENASNRATIFSAVSDSSGNAAITLHGTGADPQLPNMVASGLCGKEKCDIERSTVTIQENELVAFTIRRWIAADRPIIKVFYLSKRGQVLVEFDGDETALRRHQAVINDLLTQAVQQSDKGPS